jgi:hypothetical protein
MNALLDNGNSPFCASLILDIAQGTSITVENLFYNVPNRLAALKSHADEFNRIADVMTRLDGDILSLFLLFTILFQVFSPSYTG